jgi:hypothetical protein
VTSNDNAGISNDSEEQNGFLIDDKPPNRRQSASVVVNTPNTKDSPAVLDSSLKVLRVINQSCPTHGKNIDQQSQFHRTTRVNRLENPSLSNTLMLDNPKRNESSADENLFASQETMDLSAGNRNRIQMFWAIVTVLVLCLLYKFSL